jgi:hypothetical protein
MGLTRGQLRSPGAWLSRISTYRGAVSAIRRIITAAGLVQSERVDATTRHCVGSPSNSQRHRLHHPPAEDPSARDGFEHLLAALGINQKNGSVSHCAGPMQDRTFLAQ